MTVPHITIEQMEFIAQPWTNKAASVAEINARIDAYNEEQSQEQPIISAEEARKLGVGNAMYLLNGVWIPCDGVNYSPLYSYRVIKQPEPIEPHAEIKAMYEQQVKDGTLDNFVWEFFYNGLSYTEWRTIIGEKPQFMNNVKYRCTPKPTCQVQNLDSGELKTMTREDAQKLQAETMRVCDWFVPTSKAPIEHPFIFDGSGIYTYKLRPLYTSPQALPNETLDELLGQYWDIGYKEGDTREPDGSAANDVLHKIRMLVKPLQPITGDDVTAEMHQEWNKVFHEDDMSLACPSDGAIMAAAYNAVIKNRSKE